METKIRGKKFKMIQIRGKPMHHGHINSSINSTLVN